MVGSLLLRGLLAGLVASLLCFAFLKAFGEPAIERAIALEAVPSEHPDHAGHGNHGASPTPPPDATEEKVFSRSTQSGIGLLTAVVLFGTSLGGVFALAFAGTFGRLGSLAPRATAALIAMIGFLAAYAVPSLKYPANPPGVGDPATLNMRTGCFFIMIACSLTALLIANALRRGLLKRLGGWNATLTAVFAYILTIGVVFAGMPTFAEAPEGFPAELLWRFRLASFGGHAVLWTTIGLIFGVMAQAGLERHGLGRKRHLETARN